MIDTKRLRELAQAATPGKWLVYPGATGESKFVYAATPMSVLPQTEQDMDYIAAANPQAILELLNERSELIARLEIYEAALTNIRSDLCWLLDRHELPNLLSSSLEDVCEALEEGKKV